MFLFLFSFGCLSEALPYIANIVLHLPVNKKANLSLFLQNTVVVVVEEFLTMYFKKVYKHKEILCYK